MSQSIDDIIKNLSGIVRLGFDSNYTIQAEIELNAVLIGSDKEGYEVNGIANEKVENHLHIPIRYKVIVKER